MTSIKFRILGGAQKEFHCSFRCYIVWVANTHNWTSWVVPFILQIFCCAFTKRKL
jgi:hypothetical protein